ncbi:MAG TPA: 5-(carboxyamino)imidazole ribonucleotide mutase [Bdellovibrionota bacterium]|nr:5-(carboxyamino)imidazole ribonucleotide mutase [Bdellovibrionota bacterium]
MKPSVLIVMGSISDLPLFEDAEKILKEFGIPYDIQVMSAHRSPKLVAQKFEQLPKQVQVVIAAAGGAAHLAGLVAAHTTKPVIGVPATSTLNGLDSLLSTSQMPVGVPVATMAVGKPGGTNAAILAAEILALADPALVKKLEDYRSSLVSKIEAANRDLQKSRQ